MPDVEKTAAAAPAEAAKPAVSKIDAAAAKALREAASKAVENAEPAFVPAPVKTEAAPAPVVPAVAAEPVAPAATPLKTVVAKAAAKTLKKKAAKAPKVPAEKPVLAETTETPAPARKTNLVTKLKDTLMETVQNTEATTAAKNAFAKGTELAGEATEFTKANLEAVVESGKIFFAGAQELLKDNVETGKTVVETLTEDAKKMAAIKSPTELFQLQGEITRRNFDAMVAYGSKRTEAWVKLYNDAFAPISNRVSVAVEKVKTAA